MTNHIQANQYWQLPEVAEYRCIGVDSLCVYFENGSHEMFVISTHDNTIYKCYLCDEIYEFIDGRTINFKNKKEKELYNTAKNIRKRTVERTNCNVQ